MKTVTYEQFKTFHPCWDARRLKRWSDKFGGQCTALDILKARGIPSTDKLWAVLREEFIDAPILHEFACRCAESALKLIKPDPRSVAAIAAKRAWLRGEITDHELDAAGDAARDAARAAARDAAWAAAWAAWAAARAAWAAAGAAARDAAWDAARDAAEAAAEAAAWAAAWDAARDAAEAAAWAAARAAAEAAAWAAQVKMLVNMLERE